MFTSVHSLNGSVYHALFYDSSVTYFGKEHNYMVAIWHTCHLISCICCHNPHSCFDSLPISVFSKVSLLFSHTMALSSCLCGFLSRFFNTRMGLSQELTIVIGLHSLVCSSGLHYSFLCFYIDINVLSLCSYHDNSFIDSAAY